MVWGLESIRSTCAPRKDVLQGGLADNHFAAQLDQVVRNPAAYPIYGDAAEFFALTYPTIGLRQLLSRTFGRLSGARITGAEHGVIRSETSFGGGKTHGLIAVYHLATGARPLNVGEFIEPDLLPDRCQVAAVVADTLDPENGLLTNGMRSTTIWGEIGAQLGTDAYDKLRLSDESRTVPGKETLSDAVGKTPTIIIIDEIAQHLRQLTSSGNPEVRRMAAAIPVFLKNLFELAAGCPNVVVIITLATRSDAFGKEADELTEALDAAAAADARDAFRETQSIVARPTSGSSIVIPAADDEIAAILKRRLFASIDPDAATTAGRAYQRLYETLGAKGEQLSGGPEAPSTYATQISVSYPFHPELIRVLDKRIGTIPNFQRARGALKLLADAIGAIWDENRDTEIINVADLPFGRSEVLGALTIGLGRPDFAQVADVDFAGPTSHAAVIDAHRFAGRLPYATRACTTVFTHSLEMVTTAGASRNDYLVGTLRADDQPEVIDEALAEAERVAWHLAYDGVRWRFSTEPNANRIIDEEADNVAHSLVAAELDDRVRTAFPSDAGIEVIHAVSSPASVKDEPKLRLAIPHHDDISVRTKTATPPPPRLVEILERVGQAEGIRTYRNAIAFLVADADAIDAMRDQARRDIAAHKIVDDKARLDAFAPEVQRRLRAMADTARLNARVALMRCYRHLYYPMSDKANGNLRHEELTPKTTGNVQQAQTKAILDALTEYGKVRSTPIATNYLQSKAWPKDASETTTDAVNGSFWADHAAAFLLDATLLRDAIREGVRNGSWIYYDANEQRAWTADDAPAPVQISKDAFLYTLARAQELGLLGRAVRWEDINTALTGQSISGAALRSALEEIVGKEPTKTEVSEVLARAAEGGEDARIVVVPAPVAAGARALTPSDIRKQSLDSFTVLRPDEADRLSIERPGRTKVSKVLDADGPPGVAFQLLEDKILDTGPDAAIAQLSITATAEHGEGLRDLRLLAQSTAMLPKFDLTVSTDIELDFAGLSRGVEIPVSGPAKDFQKVEDAVMGLAKVASEVAGTLRVDVRFEPTTGILSAEITQVRKVITDLQPGDVKLRANLV
jgi:hypothetical protein